MADESPKRQREEGTALKPASKLPGLSGEERRAVEEKSRPNAPLIHETIRAEGESELERTAHALLLSGLAAGLSMGFSLVVQGLLQSRLPDAPWRDLVANLGYTVGFLIVVLGRQQLFTENTLTPILPLLHNRDGETLWRVLRLWALVLAANVAGTYLFAAAAAHTGAFGPEAKVAFAEISRHAIEGPFGTTFVKAVFAGWLIALMVWLLPAAEGAGSIVVIVVITYVVALPPLAHIVAGSVEAFYLVETGEAGWRDYLVRFFAPTLLGNVVGGVALVAVLNYGQVAPELED
jgi:formate/nitrite transporter FocA (FNT family)